MSDQNGDSGSDNSGTISPVDGDAVIEEASSEAAATASEAGDAAEAASEGGGLLQEGLEKGAEYVDDGLEAIGVPEPISDILGSGTEAAVKDLDPKNVHSAMMGTATKYSVTEALKAAGLSDDVAGAIGSAAEKGIKKLYDLGGDLDEAAGEAEAAAGAATGAAAGASGAVAGASGAVTGASGAVSSAGGAVEGATEKASAVVDDPIAAAAAILGGSPDSGNVEVQFESDALADIEFEVTELSCAEELNYPYEIRARLRTESMDVEPGMLLGTDCRFSFTRGSQAQRLVGLVYEVVEGSSSEHYVTVELVVVPALWVLGRRRNTRIFQEKTVQEIVEKVLREALGEYEREIAVKLTRSNYPTCEYRVQYDETDLDFVHRLMEEEGIVYWFDHEGEKEVMVLVDDLKSHESLDRPEGEMLILSTYAAAGDNRELVSEFHRRSMIQSTLMKSRHWDWTRVQHIEAEAKSEPPSEADPPHGAASPPMREEYDQDNRPLTLHEYDTGQRAFQANDVDDQIRLRRDLQVRDARVGEGESSVLAMRAGRTFSLDGHRQPELNGEYLCTRVVHRYVGAAADSERWSNRFTCLPVDVQFRPARRTHKPRIHSLQTAKVVGPSGEEIHTDEHGRIKVQFHWDRLGENDEHSSCWIRVRQPWAGPGWGFVFIPRIGMEVTVTFLDGDPDRPLVNGTVYNGENATPYPLPDEKTKSTIKTNSSPGGGGYNELTFEDAAGSEQIIVHAQKDYNETVENNHSTTVHNNQTNTVDADQTESVGKNQTMSVGENRTVTIGGEQKVEIKGGLSDLDITGDYKVDATNTIEVQAPTHIKLTCGGSSILIEPGKITIEAGGEAKLVLDAEALAQAAGGATMHLNADAQLQSNDMSTVLLDANAVMQSSQGSFVQLDGNAKAHANSGADVELKADALVKAKDGGELKLDGDAKMKGGSATVEGDDDAELKGGDGSVKCDGGGVAATGTEVKLNS